MQQTTLFIYLFLSFWSAAISQQKDIEIVIVVAWLSDDDQDSCSIILSTWLTACCWTAGVLEFSCFHIYKFARFLRIKKKKNPLLKKYYKN